jgi:hypothetical protein
MGGETTMRSRVILLSVLVAFLLVGGVYLATGQAQDQTQSENLDDGGDAEGGQDKSTYPLECYTQMCIATPCSEYPTELPCCKQEVNPLRLYTNWKCCNQGKGNIKTCADPDHVIYRQTDGCAAQGCEPWEVAMCEGRISYCWYCGDPPGARERFIDL